MTPEERNLINGLFERMRSYGAIEKEREADDLINTQVRQIPDSAYMLVQSVLVQEQALATATNRVQQLEARVRDLETASKSSQSSGGSFLGGLFGGGARPAQPTSVPATRAPANSPWGQPAQPQYQQPQAPMQQYPTQAAPAGRAGGGFLAQAMTTAAGVAGGMLVADSIRNMMGGHHGLGGLGTSATGYDQASADSAQDAAQDQEIAQQQPDPDPGYAVDDNDPGTSAASDDSGSWDSGGGDSTDA